MQSTTIMLVEDDLAIQENLAAILEDEGYAVRRAGNGREALEALESGYHPDLILLDLMMPIMTGWELRDRMLRQPALSHIPVAVLSGVSDVEEHAARLHAAIYLRKPIALEELLTFIEGLQAVLQHSAAEGE